MTTPNFNKTPKQKELTRLLTSDATEIMAYGGGRAGKTFAICRAIFIRASKIKSRHLICRKHFNHAKTALCLDTIPKMLAISLPQLKPELSKTDWYYTLPNGSEVWVGGLDNGDRVEKILGKEYSTIYFNECSQIPYDSISIVKSRLAEKNSLKKKLYYDMNPPAKSHWSYWKFVKGIDPIDSEKLDMSEIASMIMNPADNIDNIDETYLRILEQLPEKDKNRFLYGIFADADDGIAYYEFKREDHVREFFGPPDSVSIGMDFNVHPMTAVIGAYDGKFWIWDEAFLENSDTPRMCKYLQDRDYIGDVYPDSTGKNRKTTGTTDFKILEESGFRIKGVRNPFVTDRVNNLNRLFKAGKIVIHPRCKKLINDLEKVSWKNNELDQKTDKMLTHISDALGYLTWTLDSGILIKNNFQLGRYQ